VNAGPVIVGDPFKEGKADESPAHIVHLSSFLIGAFEVTNTQYAAWLNTAFPEAKIFYDQGIVTDAQGRLLCKTVEAEAYSQISARLNANGGIDFQPSPGKDLHPVINVSWFGAMAYCTAHNYRLPTEAEWEKAAGMDISLPSETLRKYRYGFSRDVIDPSWANYKPNDNPLTKNQVLTTAVGFYNGINTLTPNQNEPHVIKTNAARSPVGAYDMSGNVWEWVADWYQPEYGDNKPTTDPTGPSTGTGKVAKGGCYDSLTKGVRVAERLALPPEHADPYTGFRVAKDPTEGSID
jgi:formylglycine-generating enzyme required for sulfatase activity